MVANPDCICSCFTWAFARFDAKFTCRTLYLHAVLSKAEAFSPYAFYVTAFPRLCKLLFVFFYFSIQFRIQHG